MLSKQNIQLEEAKGGGKLPPPLYAKTKGGRQKVNCANVEGTLRLIQSIPSKKAEPFKLWLAQENLGS